MSILRQLLALAFPARSTAPPADLPGAAHRAIASAFREWASARGLRVLETKNTGLRMIGRLGGRDVVVDPGIDAVHPGWVLLTIAVARPAVKPMLVTRATRAPDYPTGRIRALFDDGDLGPELRAISVSPHHIRLRLAPGASPRTVELAVEAVGDTLRFVYAARESEPRHSCSTTVPYPG